MYMHVTMIAVFTQHDVPLQVGPTHGRKMMKGLLSFMGVHASEVRVGESLSRVNPGHHDARRRATALKQIQYLTMQITLAINCT